MVLTTVALLIFMACMASAHWLGTGLGFLAESFVYYISILFIPKPNHKGQYEDN